MAMITKTRWKLFLYLVAFDIILIERKGQDKLYNGE